MIDPDKRKAIFQLHIEGMSLREISRRLHVSRKTVRKIIQQQGQMPDTVRKDKREIDPDLLRRLYGEPAQECRLARAGIPQHDQRTMGAYQVTQRACRRRRRTSCAVPFAPG